MRALRMTGERRGEARREDRGRAGRIRRDAAAAAARCRPPPRRAAAAAGNSRPASLRTGGVGATRGARGRRQDCGVSSAATTAWAPHESADRRPARRREWRRSGDSRRRGRRLGRRVYRERGGDRRGCSRLPRRPHRQTRQPPHSEGAGEEESRGQNTARDFTARQGIEQASFTGILTHPPPLSEGLPLRTLSKRSSAKPFDYATRARNEV